MLILQLSNKSPWPPREGGPIAMNALVTGLQDAGHVVHIATMSTPKFPIDINSVPLDYAKKTAFISVEVDNRIHFWDAFLNLFSHKSYNIQRFMSEEFENTLIDKLNKTAYDVVVLESLYVTPYISTIRKYSNARIILRAHNIEHKIWERLSRAATNPFKHLYLKLLAHRLFRFEQSVLPTVDGIAAITDKDAAFFREFSGEVKVSIVPFGIIPEQYIYSPQEGRHISFCHIGSMDWMPNQEGIRWFLEKCWPGIHSVFPDLKFFLAGRNMPPWLKFNIFPGIEVVGEVEDAYSFISNHAIMLVPLLSGSGVRVKIIEAMALGRTVITTTTGAEGISYTQGENILIADSPIAFFEKIKYCVKHHSECAEIGCNARKLIESKHNNTIATNSLLELIEAL
jgi:polysaccharide biosynthesis protein PslH